jgi:hypothetical protein
VCTHIHKKHQEFKTNIIFPLQSIHKPDVSCHMGCMPVKDSTVHFHTMHYMKSRRKIGSGGPCTSHISSWLHVSHTVKMYSRSFYRHATHVTRDICLTYWVLREDDIILLLYIICLMEIECEDVNLHRMCIHGGLLWTPWTSSALHKCSEFLDQIKN